jgi:predicted secreted protein
LANTYNDPNVPIKVKTNQHFEISLESNPTTGYTWNSEFDSAMLEQLHPKKFILRSMAIGGGSQELFEFNSKKIGETTILMKYGRMGENTPLKTQKFDVIIS